MEFNLWTVAEIASNVVDSALIILLASSVLKLRLQSKWFYLASITILSIICTLANMYCTSLSQMLVVLWIFLFAFLLLFTEGSLKLKLIWSLLTQVIFFGVDSADVWCKVFAVVKIVFNHAQTAQNPILLYAQIPAVLRFLI